MLLRFERILTLTRVLEVNVTVNKLLTEICLVL